MIKKVILLAGAAIAVGGAGVLSTAKYNDYQTNKKQTDAQVVKATADIEKQRQEQAKAHEQEWVVKYASLRAECEKGFNAWNKLTAFAKTTVKAPICDTAQVQQ